MPVGVSDTKHCQCLFYKSKGGARPSIAEEKKKKKRFLIYKEHPDSLLQKKINNIMLLRQFGAHVQSEGRTQGSGRNPRIERMTQHESTSVLLLTTLSPPNPSPSCLRPWGSAVCVLHFHTTAWCGR